MCKDVQENKTTNYGEHFTFCNPEMTSEKRLLHLCKSPESKQKINLYTYITKMFAIPK